MKLFHFTSRFHLPHILQNGITRGDVPISPKKGYSAPWFTSDPNPKAQQWSKSCTIEDAQGRQIGTVDKTEFRITVDIAQDNPLLAHWPKLAKAFKVRRWWYDALNDAGGGGARHWFVYHGFITQDNFLAVEQRTDAGGFQSIRGHTFIVPNVEFFTPAVEPVRKGAA